MIVKHCRSFCCNFANSNKDLSLVIFFSVFHIHYIWQSLCDNVWGCGQLNKHDCNVISSFVT